ncbi:MAG: hypothetical protein ABW035_10925 [Acidimicrobiales bacterium]
MGDPGDGGDGSVPGLLGQQLGAPLALTADDAVLFAAAVGADPSTDLDYLDLSRGLLVLPTFLSARTCRSGQEHPGRSTC